MNAFSCFSAASLISSFCLSTLAFGSAASLFSYEWNYESDSGFADINECVRHSFDAKGSYLGSEIVHQFMDSSSTGTVVENVLCKGLKRGESSGLVYSVKFLSADKSTVCLKKISEKSFEKTFPEFCGL